MRTKVLIVGGGLAGLHLAQRLHAAEVDFQLFEARDRLGGRILSTDGAGRPASDGFDVGPAWFWPEAQPGLARLVADLGLRALEQHDAGDMIIQQASGMSRRFEGYTQVPPSMRIAGGMFQLPAAIAAGLPQDRLHLQTRLVELTAGEPVHAEATGNDGAPISCQAEVVALALPPRLLASSVRFSPDLDPPIARRWRETATWMAPSAKFVAVYARPFWRERGLSGGARSMRGPLVEIHDATSASGLPALFGFVGVDSHQRARFGEAALTAACIEQLADLFGPEAAAPDAVLYKDWAADPLTATESDRVASGHPVPGQRVWISGAWERRIWLAGSETSPTEPGYLAGAVDAAQRAASEILAHLGAAQDGSLRHA